MRKKNMILLGLVSLAATALIGGTWAAWTQELTTGNEFRTAYYSTKLEEKFQSPDDWKPGVETEKNVWLSNKGQVPVLAKAVVNQSWKRRENVMAVKEPNGEPVAIPPLKGESCPLTLENGEFAAIINFNKDAVAVLRQGIQGQSVLGIPVVDSVAEAMGRWLLVDETPDREGNWTFYYIGVVDPGRETPHLIESVTMNPKAQNTVLGSKLTYEKKGGEYIPVYVDMINEYPGYDCATYNLKVTMSTVQATQAAVQEVFKTDGIQQVVVNYLASDVAHSGIFKAEDNKKLYFTEKDGVISYTPKGAGSKTEDGNWFMSFTEMVPGGIYVDQMTIENHSRKNFDIFMQIVPRSQDTPVKDELLNLITMKIFYNDQEIYNGTAMGAMDPNSRNMHLERPLGYYASGSSGKIRVELQLNPDLKLEGEEVYYSQGSNVPVKVEGVSNKYMDILTKIDWKFMVQERNTPYDPSDPGDSDGGGDDPYDPPRTRIPDGGVPTGGTPTIVTIDGEEVPLAYIPDEAVPLIGVPQTGDEQPVMMILMLMAVSGCAVIWLVIRRRQRNSHE